MLPHVARTYKIKKNTPYLSIRIKYGATINYLIQLLTANYLRDNWALL